MITVVGRGRPRLNPETVTSGSRRYAFPERLRSLRHERNWSQSEVAKRIGVERSLIANYEASINQPTLSTALKLTELFGITLDSLVFNVRQADEEIQDRELLSFFLKAEALSYETKAMIKSLIEGLLAKAELEKVRQETRAKVLPSSPR